MCTHKNDAASARAMSTNNLWAYTKSLMRRIYRLIGEESRLSNREREEKERKRRYMTRLRLFFFYSHSNFPHLASLV